MEIRPRNESKKGNVLGSSSTFIIVRRPPFFDGRPLTGS